MNVWELITVQERNGTHFVMMTASGLSTEDEAAKVAEWVKNLVIRNAKELGNLAPVRVTVKKL